MAQPRPTLEVQAREVLEAEPIVVRGRGWSRGVRLEIDGQPYGNARPDRTGDFQLVIPTFAMRPGRHVLRTSEPRLEVEVTIVARDLLRGPQRRAIDFFRRRFGAYGTVPPDVRSTRLAAVRALRDAWRPGAVKYTPGIGPGPFIRQALMGPSQWTLLGAAPVRPQRPRTKRSAAAMSGRVTSIAVHPKDTAVVYIGAAQGGVWKTIDGGGTWQPLTDDRMSLGVTCLAIDPTTSSRVYAGTDAGILFTDDDGASWQELATATFGNTTITRMVFDPGDAAGRAMFLASGAGVFESPLGDGTWNVLDGSSASDLVVIPSGAGPQLIAARPASGLWTSTRLVAGWTPWTQLADDPSKPAFPPANTFGRVALGQCRTDPRTVYAVFEARHSRKCAGIVRTRDAGTTWEFVVPPLSRGVPGDMQSTSGHKHRFDVRKPTLDAGAAVTVTTTTGGGDGHTHTITLTADEVVALAGGWALLKTTDADSSGHAHEAVMSRAQGFQTDYNLHVTVHPADPEVVYYGEVMLWKRTGADGAWLSIPSGRFKHHPDQHALAFDPGDAETVWIGNDGGVFRSTNGGNTWTHRNATLATLQYNRVAQHPQWETVLLAGAQDNGVQRAAGHVAWDFSAGADAGFVAIDPGRPARVYHGYVENSVRRSDDAGAPDSWQAKNAGIDGTPLFYPPFVLDPTDSAVCFFGSTKLWRSADRAETWRAVSTQSTSITAIAIHPRNGRLAVIATTNGTVVRLESPNGTWGSDDVVETDLSGGGLPAENVLGLAIDSNGTVWVGIGTVMRDSTSGAITNEVVYRRTSGATSWEIRSTGLPPGDPVNTLVVDPAQDNRVFCGTDLGVFRSEDAGAGWTIWDQGLPNSPVYHLAIHEPRRLLRAATYGRSAWERPIDAAEAPVADLYVRDNILDSGRVTPSPHGEDDPFDVPKLPFASPAKLDWSHSVDIKVDASVSGSFASPGTTIDALTFEELADSHPIRNSVNRLFVQIHNRGPAPATDVKVRAFFSQSVPDPIPPLPDDFWSGGRPFDADPASDRWVPVGSTITIAAVPPGDRVVEWDWSVPALAVKNFAVLVVVTCAEDSIAAGPLDVKEFVRGSKHAALKEMTAPWLGAICNWATRTQTYCIEQVQESYDECLEWRDDGWRECAEWKVDRTTTCTSWGPFSGLCTALTEVENWLCVAWHWISNVVCVTWHTVLVVVCLVFTAIVRFLTCW